jgi:hypothetical protein
MSDTSIQMQLCEAVMELIERKREETGNPTLGDFLERAILDRQFREIEGEILENPGAFEPWLIRRRDA